MAEFKRTFELDDEALRQMVAKKEALVLKGRGISEKMEELSKQHEVLYKEQTDLITEVNELKLLIVARVKDCADHLMGEFETPLTTELVDGKVMFSCINLLEEFRHSFGSFDKWKEARPSIKTKD